MTLPRRSDIHDPLLAVLAEEFDGQARPRHVYGPLANRFPDITLEDLSATVPTGANRWKNTVQFARQDLVEAELIQREPPGVWKLTEAGRRRAAERDPAERIVVQGESSLNQPASFIKDYSSVADIETALLSTERNSSTPTSFELAVGSAFMFLGFDVEHFGGAGDTDLLIDAPLGVERYSLILDTKTTAKGPVSDAQVNWLGLGEHRDKHIADYAVVVGNSFAGGALVRHARDLRVTLVETFRLVEVLRDHSCSAFTLLELRPFFEREGSEEAFLDLKRIHTAKLRHALLLRRIVEQIHNWTEVKPDEVIANPATLFATLVRDAAGLSGITMDEVTDVLTVLSSETVGVLLRRGDGFVLTTTPRGAERRILALAEPSSLRLTAPSIDLGGYVTRIQ